MTDKDQPLLRVENLTTRFHTDEGVLSAVDDVSFAVQAGETVCLVGESGSGKTVTGESITRLVECPPGEISGEVWFDGEELLAADESRLQTVRGAEIAHIFQNPQDALNPVYTVGRQIGEVLRIHEGLSKRAARKRAVDLLDRVRIADPASTVDTYPHELSGGQKQRVLVAVALAADPDLLIADEPTTALDVTIQAQILDLLAELQAEFGMAVLFITHDLGVVARIADRVIVLYAGRVMERGPADRVFDDPGHPYTRALLSCLPGRGEGTQSIGGELPNPTALPDGCRFADRCPFAVEDCHAGSHPDLVPVTGSDADSPPGVGVDPAGGTDPTVLSASSLDAGSESQVTADRRDDAAADHVAACLFHASGYDSSHLDREVSWETGGATDGSGGGTDE
jgi:peptide/nickel transport system ATP-binding protein